MTFSMAEYDAFGNSVHGKIALFKRGQAKGVAREETKYVALLPA